MKAGAVGPAVGASTVHVTGGKITGHARYGIENAVPIRHSGEYYAGNGIGDIALP